MAEVAVGSQSVCVCVHVSVCVVVGCVLAL